MTQNEFQREWDSASEYVRCFTSGSTGTPKEIVLSKEFMRESARRTNAFFNISNEARLHTCLDFIYIASKMMTVRAELAGCRLTSEFPSSHPLGDISKDEEITLLSVVPAQMEWIVDAEIPWRGIKHIIVGGAPIPSILKRSIAMSDYDVWETYGMTETSSHIALRKVSEEDMPFTTLDDIRVSLDERGCLVIDIPGESTVVTNDLASVESPREFRILGRHDNCVNSGGIKIIPEELERKLGPFIAFDYCLSSVPDAKWGERLVLVVDVKDSEYPEDFIKEAIGVRLRQYRKILDLGVKAPKEVICVPDLPKTTNGKLDRKRLRELLKN